MLLAPPFEHFTKLEVRKEVMIGEESTSDKFDWSSEEERLVSAVAVLLLLSLPQ